MSSCVDHGALDSFPKLPFENILKLGWIGITRVCKSIFLLFYANNIRCSLVPSKKILPVVGIEKFSERLDPADDHQKIVLAFECEHGIDEIVTGTLIPEMHFQAIGEEGEQIKLADINLDTRS